MPENGNNDIVGPSSSGNSNTSNVSNSYSDFLNSLPSQATAPMRPITEGFSFHGSETRDNNN